MNIQTVNKDIDTLEKALRLIGKTENYMHFQKTNLMAELCEQINVLKDKRDKQENFVNSIMQSHFVKK